MTLPSILPTGTTWLDLVTLGIAFAALVLTVRRDRALGRVDVGMRVLVEGDDLIVALTNTERRPVSIQAVGVSTDRTPTGYVTWNQINHRLSSGGGIVLADPPLPAMLEVGALAYTVKAPMSRVKGTLHPRRSGWVWSIDSYGKTRWLPLPRDVADTINAVKRRVQAQDGAGQLIPVEIDDEEGLAGRPLA
jgi:hypothetical protein